MFSAALTNGEGRFRGEMQSPFSPGLRCVRLTAYSGTPGESDSTSATLLLTFASSLVRADSTGVVLTLPD